MIAEHIVAEIAGAEANELPEPGVFTEGTNAVGESLLVRGLMNDRPNAALLELLRRADDTHVGAADRGDYFIAAANLAPQLSVADRGKHFATAIRGASAPQPSLPDKWEQGFAHRLGGMRVTRADMDSRERALFLAACLASDDEQWAAVRTQAYELLVDSGESGYWIRQALQRLGDAMREDVGCLLTQGWALRSSPRFSGPNTRHPSRPGCGLRPIPTSGSEGRWPRRSRMQARMKYSKPRTIVSLRIRITACEACWSNGGERRLLASYRLSYTRSMADTVTIRTDTDTEHALDVLTRDGTNRSEAIRQALLEAALRRERLAEMKRAFLRQPMAAPDGTNLADDIAREREG
ncbi:hypothetical protein [Symbioplanes lichenis]|uniref:hypothetical protein n=1 Tax=Symbioplanes lichenis TaxID=1629072 RepID=UPI00273868A6|nr:hypothetical protein [Actinoplanes lichenis]